MARLWFSLVTVLISVVVVVVRSLNVSTHLKKNNEKLFYSILNAYRKLVS